MSATAPTWLRQRIKDRYVSEMQTSGRLLSGMAMPGDAEGIKVTFPIIGKAPRPKVLTKSLQPVTPANIGNQDVSVDLVDRELADYIYTPDLSKMGASLKNAKEEELANSFGREHDLVLLEALSAFAETDAAMRVGDGSAEITLRQTMVEKAKIAGTGAKTAGKIYCVVPQMVYESFKLVDVFGNSDWIGDANLPLTKMSGVEKTTWNGVHYIALPDEYFDALRPAADEDYCFMWHYNAVGVETNIKDGPVTAVQVDTMEGSPWLIKDIMSTAAVGILPAGVRRFHVAQTTDIPEPA
jgi:hypothetical protein